MENLVRMINAIDFIEAHLKEKIKLEDIAREACFSEYYFHKLFHLLVGDTPGAYIKKRRLYEAAMMLKSSKIKVIDVALEYGYQSPEAFSRAFTKHFGINPIEISHSNKRLIRYPKHILTLNSLKHLQRGVSMEPRIEEKEEMKVVGPVYYGNNEKGEIPEFWKNHFHIVNSLSTKIESGVYGICFHTTDYATKGLFNYMPAVQVENFSIIPLEAVGKTLPKHKYAIFTHRGSVEEIGETYKYIHGTWFPHKKYEIFESYDFEHYTIDEEGKDVIEICIPIIEKK